MKAKYEYNSKLECFERRDKNGVIRGKKVWANIDEARRVVTMHQLGNSKDQIANKIVFNSPKASAYTVRTIIELWEDNRIVIDGDFPAPVKVYEEMDYEVRITELEHRIEKLEDLLDKSDDIGLIGKVKSWMS